MNLSIKKHQLLGLLSKQYEKASLKDDPVLGVGFDVIIRELKTTEEKLLLISSSPIHEEEMG